MAHLCRQKMEYKASVWLTDEETEVVLKLAEARAIPPRLLIQEWVVERIQAGAKEAI